jgi:catechol 2,3-dioxygenase-like lactoylglutathione lyase family enzyme
MTRPVLQSMCPFFIVSNVAQSMKFYQEKLGFDLWHQEPQEAPFFAILGRDGAQLFIKSGTATPLPNCRRDRSMRWDAYLATPDPDALSAEFTDRGASFIQSLKDTHDGLRGFEVQDPDGYVLFFGRPR